MANSRLFEWDELNLLRDYAEQFVRRGEERDVNQKQFDDFCDYIEFVLCLVYAYGWKDAEEIVGIVPMKDGLDDKAVNLEIGGERNGVGGEPLVPGFLHGETVSGSLESEISEEGHDREIVSETQVRAVLPCPESFISLVHNILDEGFGDGDCFLTEFDGVSVLQIKRHGVVLVSLVDGVEGEEAVHLVIHLEGFAHAGDAEGHALETRCASGYLLRLLGIGEDVFEEGHRIRSVVRLDFAEHLT